MPDKSHTIGVNEYRALKASGGLEAEVARRFPRSKDAPAIPQALSPGEEGLARQLTAEVEAGRLRPPLREYRFHPNRQWRADFAWPEVLVLVEVEGGLSGFGRHQRKGGYEADCEKYNAASMAGWLVLRYPYAAVLDGGAARQIVAAVSGRIPGVRR